MIFVKENKLFKSKFKLNKIKNFCFQRNINKNNDNVDVWIKEKRKNLSKLNKLKNSK
jgi:hypothetical protein